MKIADKLVVFGSSNEIVSLQGTGQSKYANRKKEVSNRFLPEMKSGRGK